MISEQLYIGPVFIKNTRTVMGNTIRKYWKQPMGIATVIINTEEHELVYSISNQTFTPNTVINCVVTKLRGVCYLNKEAKDLPFLAFSDKQPIINHLCPMESPN